MRGLLIVLMLGWAGLAQAAVYRCMVDGKPTYTDRPCAAGSAPHALPPISTLPSPGQSDLAQDYDERRERQTEVREQEDKAWLKDHAARKDRDARMNAAIAERRVIKDMSTDQVRRALGSPDEVQREGGREQWVYGTGKQRRTVQFEAGRVVKSTGKK